MVEPHFCPLDRYLIDDLASQIRPLFPDPETEISDISELLDGRVNSPQDRVGGDLADSYTAQNSVSGFEAYLFARPFVVAGTLPSPSDDLSLLDGLVAMFLGGGSPLRTIPPPHAVLFKTCHDGDTCKVVEMQTEDCRISQSVVSVRVSGIDAPEVGPYYIRNSDGVYVPNPHSPKLVENTDKLRREWLGTTQLTEEETKLVNRFIGMHIDYTGRLAGLIRNDLNTWNQSGNIWRQLEESQIEWVWDGKGEKTPPTLCGTLQPFDVYGRRLGSFYQVYPSYLGIYIHERLPALMATEGRELRDSYLHKVNWIVKRLKEIPNTKVKLLLQILGEGFPDPQELFGDEQCERMLEKYQAFVGAWGEHYLTDDQVMQILTGTVYGYEKYRNQDGDAYQAANDIARERFFGLWTEPTFRTLYEINERDPRYHPPHCPAQP